MKITNAQESDHFFWNSSNSCLSNQSFLNMISDQRGHVLSEKGHTIGLLRYGTFWDEIPFCHLLMIKAEKEEKDTEDNYYSAGKTRCENMHMTWC